MKTHHATIYLIINTLRPVSILESKRIVSIENGILKQPKIHIPVVFAVTPAIMPLCVCVSAGENVVRGHRESVKNLLEIFEGLLEYLMEEMSEESQNGGWHKLCLWGFVCLCC